MRSGAMLYSLYFFRALIVLPLISSIPQIRGKGGVRGLHVCIRWVMDEGTAAHDKSSSQTSPCSFVRGQCLPCKVNNHSATIANAHHFNSEKVHLM